MKSTNFDFRFLYALHFANFEDSEVNSRFKYVGGGDSDELKVHTLRGGVPLKHTEAYKSEEGSKVDEC